MAGLIVISAFSFVACIPLAAQSGGPNKIHFVKKAATGRNNGSNWTDAYNYLQDALAVAQPGDEIWVAQGVYHPDEGEGFTKGDRDAAFHLVPGTKLIGGFSGKPGEYVNEPNKFKSILSGDLFDNDGQFDFEMTENAQDNGKRVVVMELRDNCSVECYFEIEGLVIQSSGGDSAIEIEGTRSTTIEPVESLNCKVVLANSIIRWSNGGAMLLQRCRLILLSSMVIENHGFRGGIEAWFSLLEITDSVFESNRTTRGGGAIHATDWSKVIIDHTRFSTNDAYVSGAIYATFGSLVNVNASTFLQNKALEAGVIGIARPLWNGTNTITNSLFAGNVVSDGTGGGAIIAGAEGNYRFINCTFTQNASPLGGAAISVWGKSRVDVQNTIVWDNLGIEGFSSLSLHGFFGEYPANIHIANSLLEGPLPNFVVDDGANIFTDPEFVDPVGPDGVEGTGDEDFRLKSTSPAIDSGDLVWLIPDSLDVDGDGDMLEPFPNDINGNSRYSKGSSGAALPDMGAFEFNAGTVNGFTAAYGDLVIFPNPVRESVTVSLPKRVSGVFQIALFDITGKRVFDDFRSTTGDGSPTWSVSLSGFPAGSYVMRVSNGELVLTQNLVLLR